MNLASYSLTNKSKTILALGLAGLIPCLSLAETRITTTSSMRAEAFVVQPLTITAASLLSFGSFVAGAGTVIIPSAFPNIRSSTGGVKLVNSNNGSVSNITVSGVEGTKYTVELPLTATLSRSQGGETMSMSVTSSLGNMPTVIQASGTHTFQVGGILTVGANQSSGYYNATLPITIRYE